MNAINDNLKHMDCRNYASLDVVKGICHRSKELVRADDDHCECFVATHKCKFCDHFIAGEHYLGRCDAVESRPITYPDLITITCQSFVFRT